MQRVTVIVPVPTNGIRNDPRSREYGVTRMMSHFDVITDRNRAIPLYDSESGDSGASTSQKQAFDLGLWTPASPDEWRLFGLGVVSGQGYAEINMKMLTTGSSTDLDDNGWASPANNASASGATSFDLFKYYPRTGKFYGAKAGTHVWAFTPDGATAFDETHQALTYDGVTDAIVHSQDDNFYFAYYSGIQGYVAQNNNGTWNTTWLTLPKGYKPSGTPCEWGQCLAIPVTPFSGAGSARVILANLTTGGIVANFDAGDGELKVLEDLNGTLVGISSAGGTGDANGSSRATKRVVFRYYNGVGMVKIPNMELTSTATTHLLARKQKINNRVQFMLTMTINGTQRDGVWSLARVPEGWVLSHEHSSNNDTALSSGVLKGFFTVGDVTFVSYVTSGGAYTLSKTKTSESYTYSAIIETVKNPRMHPPHFAERKKLVAVGAMYEPLPTAGSVVVKARVDSDGSYTTMFTETTDSVVYTEPKKLPSAGTYLSEGKEVEFQLISTGGARPTHLIYVYEVNDSNM